MNINVKQPGCKKFLIEVLTVKGSSFEVPVWAIDLDEATVVAEQYENAGIRTGRIRPEVTHVA